MGEIRGFGESIFQERRTVAAFILHYYYSDSYVLSLKAPPIPRPTFSRIDILSVPNISVISRHSSAH